MRELSGMDCGRGAQYAIATRSDVCLLKDWQKSVRQTDS